MDIEKLKEAVERLKNILVESEEKGNSPMVFIGEHDRNALQPLIDTCQKVIDIAGVMPKKYTDKELQNIATELGATELHLAQIKNEVIDLCTLAMVFIIGKEKTKSLYLKERGL